MDEKTQMAKKIAAIVLNSKTAMRKIDEDFVICADGGAKFAKAVGKKIDIIIGDFDSFEFNKFDNVRKFPKEKDMSDGVLAIDYAKEMGFSSVAIYGVTGGRVDHILGNLSLFKYAQNLGLDVVGKDNGLDIYFAKGNFEFFAKQGDTFSIVPYGEATVTNAQGVYYPLNNLTISFDNYSRGISNSAVSDKVSVDIVKGEVFIFHFLDIDKE